MYNLYDSVDDSIVLVRLIEENIKARKRILSQDPHLKVPKNQQQFTELRAIYQDLLGGLERLP